MKFTLDPNIDSVMRLGYIEALCDVLEILEDYILDDQTTSDSLITIREVIHSVEKLRKGE